eukprot:CCRYP_001065-RH/>CCRYP_001065-RH protein AED:0.36 eAED:0.37 QI:557/0.33/0.5/1/0/0/4/0/539
MRIILFLLSRFLVVIAILFFGGSKSFKRVSAQSATPSPSGSQTNWPSLPVVYAFYDHTLGAPRCNSTGSECSSGTLLVGRGTLSGGNELNAPNTIDGCVDGNGGSYKNDESIEGVTVRSVSGAIMASGNQVIITASVWVWGASSDFADFYYTVDAYDPNWQYIGTVIPPGTGARNLTISYTLPYGANNQAVRVNFRYGGSINPCTTGSYDDRDDLIFAVVQFTQQPTINPTTAKPTLQPTTSQPTSNPTQKPTLQPTSKPSLQPTKKPTLQPITSQPTSNPTQKPTLQPTSKPTLQPTPIPTLQPTTSQPTPRPNQPKRPHFHRHPSQLSSLPPCQLFSLQLPSPHQIRPKSLHFSQQRSQLSRQPKSQLFNLELLSPHPIQPKSQHINQQLSQLSSLPESQRSSLQLLCPHPIRQTSPQPSQLCNLPKSQLLCLQPIRLSTRPQRQLYSLLPSRLLSPRTYQLPSLHRAAPRPFQVSILHHNPVPCHPPAYPLNQARTPPVNQVQFRPICRAISRQRFPHHCRAVNHHPNQSIIPTES